MSNKLTYKKVYVNSSFRLPQSRSSTDFVIELNENFEVPEGTKMWVSEVSLPATFKTTEVGFFEYFYYMLYNDSGVLLRNGRVYLGNKIYFSEQFCDDIVAGLNNDVRDLNSDNDIFVYAYSASTRTVEIRVADGLNFRLKIPTDDELSNYVNNTWSTVSAPYDNRDPVSINYLLSNYVPTSPLAVWTSSYLNLVPFRALYLNSVELTDHRYSAPNNFSSSIIRKILIDQQLGGVVNDDHGSAMGQDYIYVGNKNLKRLSFRLTDQNSKTMNLYGIPFEFSLLFHNENFY